MEILIVSPYFPYPTNFGGAFDIYNKIIELDKKGFNITLVATVNNKVLPENREVIEKIVHKLIIVERKKNFLFFLSLTPYQVVCRRLLSKIKFDDDFKYIILEGEYVGKILENETIKNTPFVLRLHNNECVYFRELFKSEKKIIPAVYYFIEAILFSLYSKKVIKKANRVCCVSSSEAESIKKLFLNKDIRFTPVILERNSYIERTLANPTVLYVGALFTPNNIESLKWYINNVHPLLKDIKGYNFKIVGSTKNEKQKHWLNRVASTDNSISVFFDVDNLESFYDEASVFINPVLNGAGVKIKNLNAIIKGLPLVTTSKGNEGTGFSDKKHVLIADEPIKFATCVRNLLLNKELRDNLAYRAKKTMDRLYNKETIINDFIFAK